jgi:hypothetical protein
MKKVSIGSKPTALSAPNSPDDWVSDRSGSDEPMKRLTIDIPLSLHKRVKSQCALKGEKMAEVVRELLEKRFGHDKQSEVKKSEPLTEIKNHDSVTFGNHDADQTGS